MSNINKNLSNVTPRNNLNDRFKDINHVKDFFGKIGFEYSKRMEKVEF